MLTGNQVRVRFYRDRIVPLYLDADDAAWLEAAEQLLEMFRGQEDRTRGELDEEIKETFGSDPKQLVHQGLAKLLEDRCEFEVVAGHPPEQLREAVFVAAAWRRRGDVEKNDAETRRHGDAGTEIPSIAASPCLRVSASQFHRDNILKEVADTFGMTPAAVEQGLFADLKSEQRLVRFKDISAEHLLQRYNVALAQAVLLRSTGVVIEIRGESPQRYRQLFRSVKFHRLICEVEQKKKDIIELRLDGPLSLFSATQKYGLQLALFLPSVLRCQDFSLDADLLWGPQRKPKKFNLTAELGLVSHSTDSGMYVPPELTMFVDLFRKKVADWEIEEETRVFPLGRGAGTGFWVPDYCLTHRATGKKVLLEVLGFWRRSSAERHLERLRQHAKEPFLLAVSDQLHIDDAELEGLPAGIHRFRQMPLPEEIARLAGETMNDE